MKCTQSARTLKAIVYGIPFIVSTSVFLTSALATSLLSDEVSIEIDASRQIEIGREIYRDLSSAENLKSGESRGIDRITLQNIHSIKDFDIFRSEMMTKSELAKFRNDLKQVEDQDQLEQYLATHRERMNARAIKRGVVPD